VPSALRPDDGDTAHRQKPSLARSHHVRNHIAHPRAGYPRPNWAGKDQLHYDDSDPDNHVQHPKVRDARHSPSLDAHGPQVFTKRIRQTPFPVHFRASSSIVKYSRDTNPVVWLEDFHVTC
jgi:hypothetical protein